MLHMYKRRGMTHKDFKIMGTSEGERRGRRENFKREKANERKHEHPLDLEARYTSVYNTTFYQLLYV